MKCRSAACIAFRVPWNFLWERLGFGTWSSRSLWEILMESCTVAFFDYQRLNVQNGIATDKYSFHRTSFFFLFYDEFSLLRIQDKPPNVCQPPMTGPITHLHINNHTYVTKLKSTVGFYDFYHISHKFACLITWYGVWRLAFGFRSVLTFQIPIMERWSLEVLQE